jgi:hypothetical protein
LGDSGARVELIEPDPEFLTLRRRRAARQAGGRSPPGHLVTTTRRVR